MAPAEGVVRGQTWYLDDIPIGYVHRCGSVEVTAEDIALFETRFGPAMPLRADEAAGAPQGYVFAAWTRLVYEETKDWPILTRLGQDAVRWYAWTRAGDVLGLRLTMSAKQMIDEERGILFAEHEVTNQKGELVLSLLTRTVLARRALQPPRA